MSKVFQEMRASDTRNYSTAIDNFFPMLLGFFLFACTKRNSDNSWKHFIRTVAGGGFM